MLSCPKQDSASESSDEEVSTALPGMVTVQVPLTLQSPDDEPQIVSVTEKSMCRCLHQKKSNKRWC